MRQQRKSKKLALRANKKHQWSWFIFISIFIFSTIGFLTLETKRLQFIPLSPIPIPNSITTTYLPGPLQLPTYIASVLGTQTIEPTDIVTYVNKERTLRGTHPLRISPLLMNAAQMRADVILRYQNFSHQDPNENIELLTVLPSVGYHFRYASENIGMGGLSGEDFVHGFMNSTAHRENLLNPSLSDTGVGIATGPYQQYFVNVAVQLFAIPGGKDEYLGYTPEDIETYKKSLSQINAKLNPLMKTLAIFMGNESDIQPDYKKLQRQKEILVTILAITQKEEPFTDKHVTLITEYNTRLN